MNKDFPDFLTSPCRFPAKVMRPPNVAESPERQTRGGTSTPNLEPMDVGRYSRTTENWTQGASQVCGVTGLNAFALFRVRERAWTDGAAMRWWDVQGITIRNHAASRLSVVLQLGTLYQQPFQTESSLTSCFWPHTSHTDFVTCSWSAVRWHHANHVW